MPKKLTRRAMLAGSATVAGFALSGRGPIAEAERARAVADRCGMKIHSVMCAWVDFNQSSHLEADIASVERALAAAQGYGGGAILLVPCRVSNLNMPEPWEFDVAFDRKTGVVTHVVQGDNTPYQDYINAQNYATKVSREALKRLAPVAEKTGVLIAIENVWNNLWVTPELSAHFVRSVESPWVKYYYGLGNHVKCGRVEDWIRTLGDLIVKLHIKDFALEADGHGGNFVNIRPGSIDWPSVRAALDKIGYNGWATAEGSGELTLAERSKRLDQIIAGK